MDEGVLIYEGIKTYGGVWIYRGHPNVLGASKCMGVSLHIGGV